MKPSVVSKVGSILISTTLVIAFAVVQAPLRNSSVRDTTGVVVRKPVADAHVRKQLNLVVGKSIIVDSKPQIVRASVADPTMVDAVTIDSHEILVNAKTVGATTLTLWQVGGQQKAFTLNVAANTREAEDARLDNTRDAARRNLVAFYGKVEHLKTSFSGEVK
jgi:Flp pilus assembly secretin CpaC